jgi:Autographiviridae putative DNA helicase
MSLEMTLLRLAKDRETFFRLKPHVPAEGLEETAQMIVRALRGWYDTHKDADKLDLENFRMYLEEIRYKTLPSDKLAVLLSWVDRMSEDVPAELASGMIERLLATEFAADALKLLSQWHEGAELDIVAELAALAEGITDRMQRNTRLPLVTGSPEDLMAEDMDDSGLKFRLRCLADNMRGLRGGDFGIVAAAPDAGKTTLLCSESTFWLTQLDVLWPGQNRTGVWLNNEGPGGRIRKRWYQSLLNATIPEMADLVEQGRLEDRPLFTEAITKAMGMGMDRMRFYDIHDHTSADVENILKQANAGFVIFDMLDNVKFHGLTANGGERTDQVLEAMYQQGRNWCVRYNCIGFATSQLSVDGANNRHPAQHMLKDSKVGKQGACDFIIAMGKDNDPTFANVRWVNTPKNKLSRPGKKRDPRAECIFDADRARVYDPSN